MKETGVSTPYLFPVENDGSSPTIHLEFGIHEFDLPGLDNTQQSKKALQGDLSAHYWNPQVAKRVRKYCPQAILSDSLTSGLTGQNPEHVDLNDAFSTWFTLPGSPQELNGTNHIFAIAGDWLDSTSLTASGRVIESAKAYAIEDFGTLALGFATAIAASKFSSVHTSASHEPQSFSRRAFLKKSGLYAAEFASVGLVATPLVRWLSVLGASMTTDSRIQSTLQGISNALDHKFSKATWVDGRTALLIAKSLAATPILPGGRGDVAVVMGSPHLFNSNHLLRSKEARAHAIQEYTKGIMSALLKADPSITPDMLKRDAPSFFAQSTVYDVYEPTNPQDDVRQLVRFNSQIQCEEVNQALQNL